VAHYNLAGLLLSEHGALDDALAHYRQALAVGPDDADTHNNMGNIFRQKGDVPEALAQYNKAIALQPDLAEPHCNLGATLLRLGRLDEGVAQFEAALDTFSRARRQPYGQAGLAQVQQILAQAHTDLGHALFQQQRTQEALSHFQRALDLRPELATACDSLAWVLATSPKAADRDGTRALTLARQAEQLTGSQNPWVLGTLGAAYAETGQFPQAVESARRAEQLALASANTALAQRLRQQIELYQAGSPYRDTGYAGN
jgi:tetratricopeptide (TPR) repeat protein